MAKLVFETSWKGGKLQIHTAKIEELNDLRQQLGLSDRVVQRDPQKNEDTSVSTNYPSLQGHLGCADSIRTLLTSDWGKQEPRNESELNAAMKWNGKHYPHGTISGQLSALHRRQEIRRVTKKGGSYAYAINDAKHYMPSTEAPITA